jgi:hypothetical protein
MAVGDSAPSPAVPALVGSNLTEGVFFPRKEPPPGHGCVCKGAILYRVR